MAYTVVQGFFKKYNSHNNENGQISTSIATTRLNEFWWYLEYNYIAGMAIHTNPRGTATTFVVLANTCFGSLLDLLHYI